MALPYEIFIGLRYLRAKRRNRTISFNTIVSIVGITLGVAALIGTVGIMTGFKEDIQAKILGTTAHILVNDRMKESMGEYEEQVKKVAGVPDVLAATPFIFRQVLLTSQSGVQGIILRGIDPAREGTVTELAHNLLGGSLEDLAHPVKVTIPEKEREPNGPETAMRPGIILGKELSMRLGVFAGDTLNVVSPVGPITGASMTPKIRQFVVVGLDIAMRHRAVKGNAVALAGQHVRGATEPFRAQWQTVPDNGEHDNAFKVQWEAFLRHVVDDEPFPWDFLAGARGVQLAEAGLRSAREGRRVPIEEIPR